MKKQTHINNLHSLTEELQRIKLQAADNEKQILGQCNYIRKNLLALSWTSFKKTTLKKEKVADFLSNSFTQSIIQIIRDRLSNMFGKK